MPSTRPTSTTKTKRNAALCDGKTRKTTRVGDVPRCVCFKRVHLVRPDTPCHTGPVGAKGVHLNGEGAPATGCICDEGASVGSSFPPNRGVSATTRGASSTLLPSSPLPVVVVVHRWIQLGSWKDAGFSRVRKQKFRGRDGQVDDDAASEREGKRRRPRSKRTEMACVPGRVRRRWSGKISDTFHQADGWFEPSPGMEHLGSRTTLHVEDPGSMIHVSSAAEGKKRSLGVPEWNIARRGSRVQSV